MPDRMDNADAGRRRSLARPTPRGVAEGPPRRSNPAALRRADFRHGDRSAIGRQLGVALRRGAALARAGIASGFFGDIGKPLGSRPSVAR